MLTSAGARERLGISRYRLEELIRTGEIEAIKTGDAPNSHFRISEESVDAWIERRRVPVKAAS